MRLRAATFDDAAAIAAIYAPFVTGTTVTFETEPPDATEIAARMKAAEGVYPWIVAVDGVGRVVGYAYAGALRTRAAYRFAVETSVYVAPAEQRNGIGGRLYRALLRTLKAQGFAHAVGVVTLPNPASEALHASAGFVLAGVYRQIGYKAEGWHDVGLWQCPLAPMEVPPDEPRPLGKTGLLLD